LYLCIGLYMGRESQPWADLINDVEGVHPADADNAYGAVTFWGRFGVDSFRYYLDDFLGTITTFL